MLDTSKWKLLNSFVNSKVYPKLPCLYCDGAILIDNESITLRTLPESYRNVANRDYLEYKKERKNKQLRAGNEIKGAFEDHVFWGLMATIHHAGEEFKESSSAIDQCMCFFQCDNCSGSVAAVGLSRPYNIDKASESVRAPDVKFEYFTPTVPMMRISKNVPSAIRKELIDSFKHYHFDPLSLSLSLSSASKLRRCIEQFCEDQGAKGSNLHQKISSIKASSPEESKYLMALKLVENEGTHSYNVDEDDLLMAFKVFQFVLELYDRKARFKETLPDFESLSRKFDTCSN